MRKIRVSVMNTSREITEILQEVLQDEGFETGAIFTYLLKGNEEYFDDFVAINKPDVIVYDIAIPYEENYKLFKKITKRDTAKEIPFVLTTTNKIVLDRLVGKTSAYEIIGKPFDLSEVVQSVKKAYKESKNKK